jgi:cell division GTPase FtsZ
MSRIKIIAIGDGGNNTLNRLLESNWENAVCIAADEFLQQE